MPERRADRVRVLATLRMLAESTDEGQALAIQVRDWEEISIISTRQL